MFADLLSTINSAVRWATRGLVVGWITAIPFHLANDHPLAAGDAVLGLVVTLVLYPFLTSG